MIQNQILAAQLLDIINELIEAALFMHKCATVENYVQIEVTAKAVIGAINELKPHMKQIKEEITYISAPVSCENLVACLENITKLTKVHSVKLIAKLEFELIPLLKEFYYDVYFFTSIFGNKEKERAHYAEEFVKMGANPYIDEYAKLNNYKYDVSIYVLAYNKLEYTIQCIESIIQHTLNHIKYELFFVNNGSKDRTKEYFESFGCEKNFHLLENCICDMRAVRRIFEGRYVLAVSNDVIVTENYLENLIKCMESDPKIAMVVPTTPNISNMQTIPAKYSNLEEMHAFAKANNISDPTRWEERTRLCNPLGLYRSEVLFSSHGVGLLDKYFVYSEFGDDALALRLRRNGYKMILAKDCYCYHFGSLTLGEAQVKENTLEKSRKLFFDRYGVDAWSPGFCYDPILMEILNIKEKRPVHILGINSGFGSNPLKIKTLYKEAGNREADLYYVTTDERYLLDYKAFADKSIYAQDVETIYETFDTTTFQYILLEGSSERIIKCPDDFIKVKGLLAQDGTLAIFASNESERVMLESLEPVKKVKSGLSGYWFVWM